MKRPTPGHGITTALCMALFTAQLQAATITVTSTADSGPGTLRAAVASAAPNDVIVFDSAINGTTISLTSGEIMIGIPLTITGNDTVNTVISGSNLSRVFNITNAGSVAIAALKLTMGTAVEGGALHTSGSMVTLTDCAITNNSAAMRGGGIHATGGSLNLVGSRVRSNTAAGPMATDGGGGIYNTGTSMLTIGSGCEVMANTATGTAGSGGGVFNNTGSSLVANNCTIAGNSATRAGGGIEQNGAGATIALTNVALNANSTGPSPGNGGGLHITGPGSATITGGTVNGNTATTEGGGLWNGTGSMTVSGTTINSNTASGALADQGGGGLFNLKGTLTVQNGTVISGNIATGAAGSGGGIMNDSTATLIVSNSTISGNSATRAGGGIEMFAKAGQTATASLTGVTITGNTTGSSPGNGGGVHITGPGVMSVISCIVSNNIAAAEGGGLWNGSGTMTIDDCDIMGNVANGSVSPAAPNTPLDLQGGGGIFNNLGTVNIVNTIGITHIVDNTAGGAPFGSGGGILSSGGTMNISDAMIKLNDAQRAGGGVESAAATMFLTNVALDTNMTGPSPGNGGGMHITGAGNTTITGGTVHANTAATEGGGLWNGTGSMTVNGTTINGNTAAGPAANDGGGGIFNLRAGTLTVQNGTVISNNTATGAAGSGGGIMNDSLATLVVLNSTITGNSAVRAGGGIEFLAKAGQTATATLTGVTITGNTTGSAPGNGGGVHITGPGVMSVTSCIVTNNIAAAEGGGLWNGSGTMTIDDCDITGNVAHGSVSPASPNTALDLQGGGGIFNNLGTVNIVNNIGATIITGNLADGATFGSGGGILSVGGSFNINGATISGNETVRAGAGIENAASAMIISNSTLNDNDISAAGAVATATPGNGGAIHVTGAGSMAIMMCSAEGNVVANEGGGFWGSGTGSMTVSRSTVNGNSALDGGGLFLQAGGGTLAVEYSTISGNTATNGGGVQPEGGTLTLTSATIASNTATTGGGVNVLATTVNSTSSLIADNSATTAPDFNGAFATANFTLLENATGATGIINGMGGNIVGVDPALQPLGNNGGPTLTHALGCGSVAVNAGDPTDPSPDQRGQAVFGSARDQGAFESQGGNQQLSLTFMLDGMGSEVTWEVRRDSDNALIDAGGPFADVVGGTTVVENVCVLTDCYKLIVMDAGGNGISGGGYVLRDADGRRIIDANGQFTSTSSALLPFCTPVSNHGLQPVSCDRTNVMANTTLYALTQPGAQGYQFWFFDPHGSYSRRILRNTNTVRPNQMVTLPLPIGLDLNVRVRVLMNGVYWPFGKACRIRVVGSGMMGREELADAPELRVYPNPTLDGRVTLRVQNTTAGEQLVDVEVFNTLGARIYQHTFANTGDELNTIVDMGEGHAPGVYTMRLLIDGRTFTERIVIE